METKRIELFGTLSLAMVDEFSRIPRTMKKLELIINSDGGLTRHCKAIVSALHQLKGYNLAITATVIGKAHSAAFIILQECDGRRATPNADLMFHAPATLRFGREGEPAFVDERNPNHEMHRELLRKLSERTALPMATLEEWTAQERCFNADEALQNRFVDEIVDEGPL